VQKYICTIAIGTIQIYTITLEQMYFCKFTQLF